jgi:parallel beta-helix repeat protein
MGRIAILIVVCLAATSVFAGEGRTPIWKPTSISAPGKYIVTRNISAGSVVIEIVSDGVDIDLNGMVLEGGAADPIIDGSSGVSNITIRNGKLRSGSDAVVLSGGRGYVVEDLDISGGGFSGIRVEGTDVAIRRNQISDRGAVGILVDAGPFSAAVGDVDSNIVENCSEGIIVERGGALTIRDNQVRRSFGSFGIRTGFSGGVLVIENTVQESASFGIVIEATNDCKVYNNLASRNGLAGAGGGIAMVGGSSNCLVLDNVASENVAAGMLVDGVGNHIERNVLNFNGAGGLVFTPASDANIYSDNTGRFNGPPPGPCAMPSPCPAPDLCDDGGFGIPNTSKFDNVFGPPIC